MIDFLSNWTQGIAIAVIIASIFEMLLPNGNIKKYVKVILGIYIVFCVIVPFTDNKVLGDFDISKKVDEYSHNSEIKDYSKDEKETYKKLNIIYENTFEKELIQTIEKEGFIVHKCVVKGIFNGEQKNAGINKVSITIESKKIIKNKVEEDDDIKIESVNEVKKVEINVGKQVTNNVEEDVEAKDIDTLRKFISKHYEIDKGIIEIHVR